MSSAEKAVRSQSVSQLWLLSSTRSGLVVLDCATLELKKCNARDSVEYAHIANSSGCVHERRERQKV